jgi:hypothetical protein|tara:strand:+ start:1307 stop:1651 length:345 start_codon:yes stop_codon:yes gene_type:complete
MTKRVHKSSDGKYHISGNTYDLLVGSRAQVHHGTAFKTSGGLTKKDIVMNKHGRIVSRKKSVTAKKEKRLEKAGYKPTKGKFKLFVKMPTKKKGRSVSNSKKAVSKSKRRNTNR